MERRSRFNSEIGGREGSGVEEVRIGRSGSHAGAWEFGVLGTGVRG